MSAAPNFEFNPLDYDTIRVIGNGTYGSVYLAQKHGTQELCALKVIPFKTERPQNLIREIEILKRICHPSLLRLVAFKLPTDADPSTTILTEYMPNGSLFEILEKERVGVAPPEWDATTKTKCILGIAGGVAYLHAQNIMHRDLKSDNILLDANYEVKICDFGLSKIVEGEDAKGNTQRVGTPLYMAPEMFQNAPYNYTIDAYAFSILLYEILTGLCPFSDTTDPMVLGQRVVSGERPVIPDTVAECYRNLMEACWVREPTHRPDFATIVNELRSDSFILPGADRDAVLHYREKVFPPDPGQPTVTYDMLLALQNYFKVRVDNLESFTDVKVSEFGQQRSELERETANMRQQMEEMRNQMMSMAASMKEITEKAMLVETENKAMRRSLESMRSENERLKAELATVKSEEAQMREELEKHSKRLDAHQTDFKNTARHLESLHNNANELMKTTNKTRKQVAKMIRRFSSMEDDDMKKRRMSHEAEDPAQQEETSRMPKRRTYSIPVGMNRAPVIECKYDNLPFDGVFAKLRNISGDDMSQIVVVTGSSASPDVAERVVNVIDPEATEAWASAPHDGGWIMFDFERRKIMLTRYTIKSGMLGQTHLQSWRIDGYDDTDWVTLDEVSNDSMLDGPGAVATYQCKNGVTQFFRYIRLQQTGPSHAGPGYGFSIQGIELFGKVQM